MSDGRTEGSVMIHNLMLKKELEEKSQALHDFAAIINALKADNASLRKALKALTKEVGDLRAFKASVQTRQPARGTRRIVIDEETATNT